MVAIDQYFTANYAPIDVSLDLLELCRLLVKYDTAEEIGIVPMDDSKENDNRSDDEEGENNGIL